MFFILRCLQLFIISIIILSFKQSQFKHKHDKLFLINFNIIYLFIFLQILHLMNNSRIINEIEALCNIYFDRIKKIPSSDNQIIEITLSSNPLSESRSHHPFCWVKARVEYNSNYPLTGPLIQIVEKYNVLEAELEMIKKHIELIIQNRIKQNYEMVHEICQYVQMFLNQKANLNDPKNIIIDTSEDDFDDSISDIHPKNTNSLIKSHSDNIKNPFENLRDISSNINTKKEEENSITESHHHLDLSPQSSSSSPVLTSRFNSDFEIKQKLGEGGGGSVYKVRNKWDNNIYAIKIIQVKIYNAVDENRVLSKVLNEGFVLSRLQHSHIVRYYQTWVEDFDASISKLLDEDNSSCCYEMGIDSGDEDSEFSKTIVLDDSNTIKKVLFIQMEFCEGKTLKEAIEAKSLLDEQKWKLIIEILDAVNYIHKNNLIHRDIKPGNIFLDKNNEVKIGDFGLARITKKVTETTATLSASQNKTKNEFINNGNEIMTYNIGTKYYCSPEQEKQKSYDNKSDMFSLGIIIFEMFYSFDSLIARDKVLRVIKDKHVFPSDFISKTKQNIVDIVTMLTETNAAKRPSARDLLNSTLIPVIVNEKVVIGNFEKIINDNKDYTEKFVDILIKSSIKEIKENETMNETQKNQIEEYHKCFHRLENMFIKEKAILIKAKSVSMYDPFMKIYDSNLNKITKIKIEDERDVDNEELMLKKNRKVYIISSMYDLFKEISQMINEFSFPLSIYSEINSDIIFSSLWANNISCDDDIAYIANCFSMLFASLNDFSFDAKRTLIRINSSRIIDKMIKKSGMTLLSMLNSKNSHSNNSGSIDTMKSRYNKKDIMNDINFISEIFNEDIYWRKKKKLLKKYKDCIKIDLCLLSERCLFHSGLIFDVSYITENEKISVVDGGSYDNIINEKEIYYKAFAMRYKINNILPLINKEEEINDKIEILLVRIGNIKDTVYVNVAKKIEELNYENKVIYKRYENRNVIDYNIFYDVYQMKMILCVQEEQRANEEREDEDESENEDEDDMSNFFIEIITKEKNKILKYNEIKNEEINAMITPTQFKKRKTKYI